MVVGSVKDVGVLQACVDFVLSFENYLAHVLLVFVVVLLQTGTLVFVLLDDVFHMHLHFANFVFKFVIFFP